MRMGLFCQLIRFYTNNVGTFPASLDIYEIVNKKTGT
jgi:hypothetical protein